MILFDQLSKIAILKTFAYGAQHELTSFFNLVLVYNRGAAFGFLSTAGGWQRWAFTALGIAATLVICFLLKRHGQQRLFSLSLAMILGGALGNVIDRLVYGHVIDFLDFHLGAGTSGVQPRRFRDHGRRGAADLRRTASRARLALSAHTPTAGFAPAVPFDPEA